MTPLVYEIGFCVAFGEVRTLGHAGAVVGSFNRSKSSLAAELHAAAARDMLQRVMQNPGPLRELSNVPEYIFAGLIFHLVSCFLLIHTGRKINSVL